MLDLARKQRMNTDIRRNIFCVLMTAEDYLDAFEKLHHLGLKNQQDREVIYVIMDCCLQEKKFNPYYAVLGQKFCDYDRKYQVNKNLILSLFVYLEAFISYYYLFHSIDDYTIHVVGQIENPGELYK